MRRIFNSPKVCACANFRLKFVCTGMTTGGSIKGTCYAFHKNHQTLSAMREVTKNHCIELAVEVLV